MCGGFPPSRVCRRYALCLYIPPGFTSCESQAPQKAGKINCTCSSMRPQGRVLILVSAVSSNPINGILRQASAGSCMNIGALTTPANLSHLCCTKRGGGYLQVRIFTSMDLIDTKEGKKIVRQYDHTHVAET